MSTENHVASTNNKLTEEFIEETYRDLNKLSDEVDIADEIVISKEKVNVFSEFENYLVMDTALYLKYGSALSDTLKNIDKYKSSILNIPVQIRYSEKNQCCVLQAFVSTEFNNYFTVQMAMVDTAVNYTEFKYGHRIHNGMRTLLIHVDSNSKAQVVKEIKDGVMQ